jgi:hypothetical protein
VILGGWVFFMSEEPLYHAPAPLPPLREPGSGRRVQGRGSTRWSTNVSSKVSLHHAIDFRAVGGANVVTYPPEFRETKPSDFTEWVWALMSSECGTDKTVKASALKYND